MLPQFINTAQGLHNLSLLLEVERNRHHTNGQDSTVLCHLRYYGSSTGACAATHAGCHEHHLRAVVEQPLDVFDVAFCLLPAHIGISTGSQAHRAQL